MIIEATAITKDFRLKGGKGFFRALDRVSFSLSEGETLGIVGESGSGKSTLAEIAGGLQKPTKGSVFFSGQDISHMKGNERREYRRSIQYIFQNPKESMNPWFTIRNVLSEPLRVNFPSFSKEERDGRISEMLSRVGLDPSRTLDLHPSSFSGGQLQRIAIARALLLEPKVLVCDECTSSLDVSLQAQILNLLSALRADYGMSMLFISHDIGVVRYISDRILVLKDGKVVETGETVSIIDNPKERYTKDLVLASLGERQ